MQRLVHVEARVAHLEDVEPTGSMAVLETPEHAQRLIVRVPLEGEHAVGQMLELTRAGEVSGLRGMTDNKCNDLR